MGLSLNTALKATIAPGDGKSVAAKPAWLAGAIVGVLGSGGSLPTGWRFDAADLGYNLAVTAIEMKGGMWTLVSRIYGTNSSGGVQYTGIEMVPFSISPVVAGNMMEFSFFAEVVAEPHPFAEGAGGERNSIQSRLAGNYVDGAFTSLSAGSFAVRKAVNATIAVTANQGSAFLCDNSVSNGAQLDVTVRIADPHSRIVPP